MNLILASHYVQILMATNIDLFRESSSMQKPFCEATDRNKTPILDVLQQIFADTQSVFEIGSGTGQHAIFFGQSLPHLIWQTSDLIDKHEGINHWLNEAQLSNVLPPIEFDVNQSAILQQYDGVFTANTFHILSWPSVLNAIEKASKLLKPNGLLVVYGPFKFNDQPTAPSNEAFDKHLQQKDANMGLRDYEAIKEKAKACGIVSSDVIKMPANNFLLVFKKAT